MKWVEEEFEHTKLGDKRLDKRLKMIAEDRISNPEGSLANSKEGNKAVKAMYRFFDNPYFKEDDILKSHTLKTIDRIKKEKIVLALQDTTSIDYSNLNKTDGLGILESKYSKGVLVHSTLAVSISKEILGIINQNIWVRKTKQERLEERYNYDIDIKEKESYRWIDSLIKTNEVNNLIEETILVNVGDRESDIYEYFHEAQKLNQSVLVRAHYNRKIKDSNSKMIDYISEKDSTGILELEIPKTKNRKERIAKLSVKFAEVELIPPKNKYNKNELNNIKVNVIIAKEIEEVEADTAINWILLTNIKINNFQEACEKLNWYSIRWQIETFHKILKSGCKVEKRRFGNVENIKKYLALDSIIAWKIFSLTMLNREESKESEKCNEIFEEEEWKVLHCYINKTKELPSEIPSLKEVKMYIAKLGGFLGRKGDGGPGITIMWRGLTKLATLVEAWKLFN